MAVIYDTHRSRRFSRGLGAVAVGALCVVALAVGSSAANAAPSDGYATLTVGGDPGARTGTVTLPGDFPSATLTSTSRIGTVSSGATSWVPGSASFGTFAGSSQDKTYISLDSGGQTAGSASVTTYEFATPAPAGSWGFALGDVDAEALTVSAKDVNGAAVPAASLGLVTAFNYCDASPRASACASENAPYAIPTVSAAAESVRLAEPRCIAANAFCDTTGASAWFKPLVPISSLTVTSAWVSGSPSYQTWLADASALSGMVEATCVPAEGLSLELLDAAGSRVATTVTGADGSYSFPAVLPLRAYEVRLASVPVGTVSAPAAPIDAVTNGPATGILLQLDSVYPVTGSVVGPLHAGLTVTLTGPDGTRTTTTDAAGGYAFPPQVSAEYTVAVTAPNGATVTPATRAATVNCAASSVLPFAIEAEQATETPTPPTTQPPSTGSNTQAPPAAASGSAGSLATTGGPQLPSLLVGGLLAILAGAALSRTRRPSTTQ